MDDDVLARIRHIIDDAARRGTRIDPRALAAVLDRRKA